MSWADADINEDPSDVLAQRITQLEHNVSTQLFELRNEIGIATATMRDVVSEGRASPLGDLEEQLARAVTISLSAALEAIRESLTATVAETVAAALGQPGARMPRSAGPDLDEVAASLQHSVLLALSTFEQSALAPSAVEPSDAPATVRDVARVNQRIDELRSMLLG